MWEFRPFFLIGVPKEDKLRYAKYDQAVKYSETLSDQEVNEVYKILSVIDRPRNKLEDKRAYIANVMYFKQGNAEIPQADPEFEAICQKYRNIK